MVLIQCLLRDRRLRKARAEFQSLLDQDPPDRDELESWFDGSTSRSIEK